MKIVEEQKHFLTLQALPGDNSFVDISKLSISNHYAPSSLAEIDSFTMYFTKEQIVDAIREANIVEEKYLHGTLCVCDNQKHNPIPVITKDFLNDFQIEQFLSSSFGNKMLINTIVNKFSSLVEDEIIANSFKNAMYNNAATQALHALFSIPYFIQRKFIIYLVGLNDKMREKEKNNKIELTRDKAA